MKHGQSRRDEVTREYTAWKGMKSRCSNPNNPAWANYGGRGVQVCARWLHPVHGFENFFQDLGARPKGTSLDRFPHTAMVYSKATTRWATRMQQNQNKRGVKLSMGKAKKIRKL